MGFREGALRPRDVRQRRIKDNDIERAVLKRQRSPVRFLEGNIGKVARGQAKQLCPSGADPVNSKVLSTDCSTLPFTSISFAACKGRRMLQAHALDQWVSVPMHQAPFGLFATID
jgi:hypothetical protein